MSECPLIECSLGKVKGRLQPKVANGKQVYFYSSIPFAKPPVGDLRFEAPVKAEPWQGVIDGSKHPPRPYQDNSYMEKMDAFFPMDTESDVDQSNISEDCLYLTVYTTNPSNSADLPVLFWIYGGAFMLGSQCTYNANVLSSLHDVVVVIPNYRVNAFGFLSLGKETNYPGNMGLQDQIMALKWVKENIKAFGGNPGNVTIFGESAGSWSVNYHMLLPASRGLFHRAISHSGTGYMEGFPSDDLSDVVKVFLEVLKIEETDPEKVIAILKKLPAEKLIEVQRSLAEQMKLFTVQVDGKFFPDNTQSLHDKGELQPIPYMVGCTNTEYHGILSMDFPGFAEGLTQDACKESLKMYMTEGFKIPLSDSEVNDIIKEYGKNIEDEDKFKWSKILGEVLGDVLFTVPTTKTVDSHAKHNKPTYLYYMTQTLQCNHDLKYGKPKMMKASFCECDHGDDLIFTFGVPLYTKAFKFTEDEKVLSIEWMKYLANFARHGDPNVGEPVQVKWPLYSVEEQAYLSVQQPCSVGKDLAAERLKFWDKFVESKHQ